MSLGKGHVLFISIAKNQKEDVEDHFLHVQDAPLPFLSSLNGKGEPTFGQFPGGGKTFA